ncbi:MAG: YraN family protein [Bacteroidia bacterium]|nr:YraN family protein [Bacteroidia bacterium]
MQNNSQNFGKKGEEEARIHLIKLGYSIRETNWRYKKLEVDIIAEKQNTIVFVEVKTRSSSAFGEPELFVDKKKQGFLIAAAHHYLISNQINAEARFDIIALTGPAQNLCVKHLEGAFYPTLK